MIVKYNTIFLNEQKKKHTKSCKFSSYNFRFNQFKLFFKTNLNNFSYNSKLSSFKK